MASSTFIRTTFLVLSDTHDIDLDTFTKDVWPAQRDQLPKIDVVLHCGDLTQVGGGSSFKKALKVLGSINADKKLVIAGNYDLELDQQYWTTYRDEDGNTEDPEDHDEAVAIMKGQTATEAGVLFLDEGTHTYNLQNGAKLALYASPYTPSFGDWAFPYSDTEDRFNAVDATPPNARAMPDHVDIVMTHGPPKGILDLCPQGNVGCDKLLQAIRRVKPIMHCFGHIHEGHGLEVLDWKTPNAQDKALPIERTSGDHVEIEYSAEGNSRSVGWNGRKGDSTLAVNASIETERGKPPNAPWLITLNLPRAI
ncbi:MAG: hypothetical protein LQ352_005341 [Teloschistes flavicans]|nr:MAG: hypothetical protein LQ352_005341 [Teloschistes flavicans]